MITIVSQYLTWHVQIILHLYKSILKILINFDINCSCIAFDGSQVWAISWALAIFITQVNVVNLTWRLPLYENHLAKYAQQEFEVYWPELECLRINQTIFQKPASDVIDLAHLLIIEKLSTSTEQNRNSKRKHNFYTLHQKDYFYQNVAQLEDAQAWSEWLEVSDYNSFFIFYESKYDARKVCLIFFLIIQH